MRAGFRQLIATAVLAAGIAVSAQAETLEVVYNNTSVDSGLTYSFADLLGNDINAIGDAIELGGTARYLIDVTLQFYNFNAVAGTFNSTLSVYEADINGNLVGSALASIAANSAITASNNPTKGGLLDVVYALPGILVSNNIAVVVEWSNITSGLDVGVNLYGTPTVGKSSDALLVRQASTNTFSRLTTPAGEGNLYLRVNASPVPELPVSAMLAIGLAGFVWRQRHVKQLQHRAAH